MGVRSGHHVGSRCMHLRMDGERRLVDETTALDDLTVVVDKQQIRHPDVTEVHAKRVDPEVVGQLGIARRDVARNPFIEPKPAEEPEPGGEALLAVAPLVLDVVEGRWKQSGLIEKRHGETSSVLTRVYACRRRGPGRPRPFRSGAPRADEDGML
jgi:hypothetical protein